MNKYKSTDEAFRFATLTIGVVISDKKISVSASLAIPLALKSEDIKVIKRKKHDIIKIKGKKKIPALNYKIPSDISSAAFFVVLTALSKNSQLKISNIIIEPTHAWERINYPLYFDRENLEQIVSDLIKSNNTNFKGVGQPLRIALTGSKFGPGIYDIIISLGKEEVVKRLGNKIFA